MRVDSSSKFRKEVEETGAQGLEKVLFCFVYCFFFLILILFLAEPGLSCSIWKLVPWPWIKPGPLELEMQSLSHWTTGKSCSLNGKSWESFLRTVWFGKLVALGKQKGFIRTRGGWLCIVTKVNWKEMGSLEGIQVKQRKNGYSIYLWVEGDLVYLTVSVFCVLLNPESAVCLNRCIYTIDIL